ncbi:phosphotransferase [candidate division WWE3 bacterium]|nr:phosphotransferase [candidate division WWE3 bacterium]
MGLISEYTDNIEKLLIEHYDLGEYISDYQFLGGIQNITRKITTTKGEYVLKQYQHSSGNVERLTAVLNAIQLLHDHGAPIPSIINTKSGSLFVPLDDDTYYAIAISQFLDGVLVFYDDIDLSHAQAAGNALAKLHQTIDSIDMKSIHLPQPLSLPERINRLDQRLRKNLQHNYLELNPSMLERIDNLWESVFTELLGLNHIFIVQDRIIHGDFIRGNLLFDGDDVCGILDFDAMRKGSFLEDLSGAVFQWFWDERKMFAYEDIRDALVHGYKNIRPDESSFTTDVRLIDLFVLLIAWEKMTGFLDHPRDEIQLAFHESLFNELKDKLFLMSARLSYN